MPTDIWKIPLDSNGVVRGSYYLRHATEISDTLGVIQFERGRSVEPVTGQRLVHFVAALGPDVDLEPADDEARAAMGMEPSSGVSEDHAAALAFATNAALHKAGKSLEQQVHGEGLQGSTVAELAGKPPLVADHDLQAMRAPASKREAEAEDAFEREHAAPAPALVPAKPDHKPKR